MFKRRGSYSGFTLVELLVGVAVVLVLATVVIESNICKAGTCTKTACSADAPCDLAGKKYDVGSRCTSEGTVCDKHTFAADCTCQTKLDRGGAPDCFCSKP